MHLPCDYRLVARLNGHTKGDVCKVRWYGADAKKTYSLPPHTGAAARMLASTCVIMAAQHLRHYASLWQHSYSYISLNNISNIVRHGYEATHLGTQTTSIQHETP